MSATDIEQRANRASSCAVTTKALGARGWDGAKLAAREAKIVRPKYKRLAQTAYWLRVFLFRQLARVGRETKL
jgi:hypothetical protein